MVAEAKTWAWEKFGDTVENDFRWASRRFWFTIRWLRRMKQCSVNTVYSGRGGAADLNSRCCRRQEYFRDLLNPVKMPSNEEAEPWDSGADTPISGAEVAEAVKKLFSSRAQVAGWMRSTLGPSRLRML